VKIHVEFIVVEDGVSNYFILGNDYLTIYGFDITNSRERYFTIGNDNKRKKFLFKNKGKMAIQEIARNPAFGEFVELQLKQSKICEELNANQVSQLKELLFKYQDAFASDTEPLGAVIGHEVDITLNIDRPYPPLLRRPAYPASPRARVELEKHINELIRLNVLRKIGHNEEVEITTPVIIAWHNDKSRMVGDFRALNNYTVPDRYPIPRIAETLTNIAKAKYITSMDALKGFHQNRVTERARKYLRIITHKGVYEYLRMPFGIKNAPSHFQRMMNSIFTAELSEGWLIVYIDDIIICSSTWEEHMARLTLVLKKVIKVNLKISLKKCAFGFRELTALGHVVSGLSLCIDQNKVAAVMKKPAPTTKKELQSFLGFASYYRQHLEGFAALARSLYEICSNDAGFEMTHERVQAFQKIKEHLTNAPLLLMPDFHKPFRLYVDASMEGLGAALHQLQIIDDMPVEGPICFISRQLKNSERRYGASQLECLCLVWALEKLHY
jgi:hypothetical protein